MDRFFEKAEFAVNLASVVAVGSCLFSAMSGWSDQAFPFVVGGLTSLLLLGRIFSATFRHGRINAGGEKESEPFHLRLALRIVLSSVAFYVLIAIVGFSLSVLLYLVVMPLALGYRRRFSTTAVALAVYLLLVVSVGKGLLNLPKGLLF